jgi:DNA repair exonuclease SbcCD nuclease subunit
MKFLHLADLHLDSPLRTQAVRNPEMADRLRSASRQVLRRAVDTAIEEGVDAVLLAGDTFDNGVADVASRAALAAEVSRLDRAGIPCVLIQGNHDALLDLDRYGPVAEALIVLTPDAPTFHLEGAAIHGVGFCTARMPESLLPRYPQPEVGCWNIGLMHTSIDGAAGHDPYAPCALADLMSHGYEYWALGHIHKRAIYEDGGRLAVMPGIPQGRSVREMEGGSATLVEIDLQGVRIREIPLELLRFARVEVDFSGAADQGARDERLRSALTGAAMRDVVIAARLEAFGTAGDLGDPEMLGAQAQEVVETVDDVFIESIRLRPVVRSFGDDSADDLAALMRADTKSPGFRDEVDKALEELRAALPAEIRDVLACDEIEDLIEEGIETMALRLVTGSTAE